MQRFLEAREFLVVTHEVRDGMAASLARRVLLTRAPIVFCMAVDEVMPENSFNTETTGSMRECGSVCTKKN